MSLLEFVRVTDEARLGEYHAVVAASLSADFVALPADPIEDSLPALSGRLADQPVELWIGLTAGLPVTSIKITYSDHDNVEVANVQLDVHPLHRGHGYGTAGLDLAIERARRLGMRRLLGEVPSRTRHHDPAPGIALVNKYAAKQLTHERRRLLDVTSLDRVALAELVTSARPHASGYSTLTWRDRAPDEYVEDLAQLHASMSTDAPQGDLDLEPEVWDVARYRAHEQSVLDRGRIRLFAVARHDATGRLAGFTDLGVPAGGGEVGYQWSTIVRDAHRGHRLGMVMKAVNLQQLSRELPEVRYVNTWNAEANSYMVAVNEELGFEKQESWSEFGLDL